MRKAIRNQSFILLVLSVALVLGAAETPIWTISLPPAIAGRPYSFQVGAIVADNGPVRFSAAGGGNAGWLRVSESGLLEGTPTESAPVRSTIRVQAQSGDGTPTTAVFLVPVELGQDHPAGEAPSKNMTFQFRDEMSITDKDRSLGTVEVIQFSRTRADRGMFGHFDPGRNIIDWNLTVDQVDPQLVNAVNASKVAISGAILVRHGVTDCETQQWKVVTESTDSSNILVYGPSDLNFYCYTDSAEIVLPVHAIWANIVGYRANTHDPTWKEAAMAPAGHQCDGNPVSKSLIPDQGIKPCDKPKGPSFYSFPISSIYNRLTQPGASQGSVSLAPVALALKDTWDSQIYLSTRLGAGWIGLTTMYEHDHKMQDDLDSATAALVYDWRVGDSQRFWLPRQDQQAGAEQTGDFPLAGLRAPEFTVRFGPEWTPGPVGVKLGKPDYGRNLNLVGAATVRLPIILNGFNGPSWRRFGLAPQPSIFSILPVVGVEEGFRVRSHQFDGESEPQDISRLLAGVDASTRWPFQWTHNFLGDKPITLEYSYRARWLFHPEPYVEEAWNTKETLSATTRSYSRITLIMPFSAYLQIRASVQRGSLPPLFQSVGNLFILGVAFSNPGMSEH
jgi:hypothetical protein